MLREVFNCISKWKWLYLGIPFRRGYLLHRVPGRYRYFILFSITSKLTLLGLVRRLPSFILWLVSSASISMSYPCRRKGESTSINAVSFSEHSSLSEWVTTLRPLWWGMCPPGSWPIWAYSSPICSFIPLGAFSLWKTWMPRSLAQSAVTKSLLVRLLVIDMGMETRAGMGPG